MNPCHAKRSAGAILCCALWLLASNPASGAQPTSVVSASYRPMLSGAGHSFMPKFSTDSRSVAFLSHANNLATNDDRGPFLDLFVRNLATSNTVLVSVSSNGAGGANLDISLFALSSNAQVVAFETAAGNLVCGDTNFTVDVFARDLAGGSTKLVSENAAGDGPGNGPSFNPLISADGRYVVFESLASNLVTNDFNGTNDVFLRDLLSGTTTLVSVNASGAASADGPSTSPSISADGLMIAFLGHATDLVAGVTNRTGEVYVRNIAAGSTLWADAAHSDSWHDSFIRNYRAFQPFMSEDGRYVAFKVAYAFRSGALIRFDATRPTNRIWLRFPGSPSITPSNAYFFADNPRVVHLFEDWIGQPTLAPSPDGRFAAFTSGTNNLPPTWKETVLRADFESFVTNITTCCPGAGQSYITNQRPAVTVMSTNFAGTNAVAPSSITPALSADGRHVVFISDAANDPGMPTNGQFRLYLRDTATNSATTLSTNRSGRTGSVVSDIIPTISPDGTRVAWESFDADLVDGDENGSSDVFVRDLATGETTLVSARHPALPALTGRALTTLTSGSFSADGSRLAFATLDNNLLPLDTNQWSDPLVRDLHGGTNLTLSAVLPAGFNAYGGAFPRLSADGRIAAYGRAVPAASLNSMTLHWVDLVTLSNQSVLGGAELSDSAPALSPDGRWVYFHADANLGTAIPDGNFTFDIHRWDSRAGPGEPRLLLISANASSSSAANSQSTDPVLSPDGCRLAFLSLATDLAPGATGSVARQVFVRNDLCHPTNILAGTNRLISFRTMASPLPDGRSLEQAWPTGGTNPIFSANNRYVFFKDGSSNVIYRHELDAPDVVTITEAAPGLFLTNSARVTNLTVCIGCLNPSPSADGRFVAYEVPATNGLTDVVLKDVTSGATELISVNLAATGGNGSSFTPILSHDARFVVFASKAGDLTAHDTNRATDVFVRDRLAGVTHCLSLNRAGTATGDHGSSQPVLAPDGRTVAFQSFASDLVEGDYNDTRDVFVVSLAGPDTDGDGLEDEFEVAYFGDLSRDGAGDFDGDGHRDRDELHAGTDPTDAGSVLRVLRLTREIAGLDNGRHYYSTILLWPTVPGRTYRVQFKPVLDEPWMDLPGDFTATGTSAQKVHTANPSPAQSYYRVLLVSR